MFSKFSRWLSLLLGKPLAFTIAFLSIIVWLITGPIFNYSDSWQLIINTATTIITFLMVFLIQNTQNRDVMAIHLKLDEIIRALTNTHNELVKIEEVSDEELAILLERYQNLSVNIRNKLKQGKKDVGIPEINCEIKEP